ncbi:hypothetical protein GWK47_040409 [Chionoecetes opilio]|uniref:Uncharacterized protein n=1 Tax=Chionoecetes opilio TaxID=41210 RepID=A0A8J4YJH9_CHIOP|nr:hypothetical protein GWK47_040409 [Chionoecetes opilio]
MLLSTGGGKMLRRCPGEMILDHVRDLAVLVSGPPAYPEGKLLGVPVIDSSTGTAQQRHPWICWRHGASWRITALLFDTTASNSGVHGELPSFWSNSLTGRCSTWPVENHILEVLVGAVWENLFGKVKSPENP